MKDLTIQSSVQPAQALDREAYINLIETALAVKEVSFARQASLQWLGVYPGDLPIRLLHARTVRMVRGPLLALPILEELVDTDPLWLEAQSSLASFLREAGDERWKDAAAAAVALGKPVEKNGVLPKWGILLLKARQCKAAFKLSEAEVFIQRAILLDPPTPLAAAVHLELTASQGQSTPRSLLSLAEHYTQRWPRSVYGYIFHAHALMESGEQERAVELLHRVVAMDVIGQVPARIWGKDNPYRSLWPANLQLPLDMPMPARVTAALGRNILTGPVGQSASAAAQPKAADAAESYSKPERPQRIHPETEMENPAITDLKEEVDENDRSEKSSVDAGDPEPLKQVRAGLEKLARQLKNPKLAHVDGRFPVYVILSTRAGLARQYGQEGADTICRETLRLARAIRREGSWDSIVMLADEPSHTTPHGLKPVPAGDAWAIKLLLSDLDAALKISGRMVGAVLIVGGPEIVPFHHLPNPVDDDDLDVPSDNPYGTRDDNYFVMEWAVGRLPGGIGKDSEPLLSALQKMTARHVLQLQEKPWYRRLWDVVRQFVIRPAAAARPSFGYTAAAWRKASIRVFRPIGEARALLASPPAEAEHLAWNGLIPAQLAYYNLHGLENTSDWYGQRDPGQPMEGPDYPVALRPADVVNSGKAPQLVFSEACFGAHIQGKHTDQALALKFMQAGTEAMVGSTCTSYGSIATPLIAADFLGHGFWHLLQKGHPAGEALRLAKINLADEMHRRQGYLDGEDQKTLISFVLYGDPLAVARNRISMNKSVLRETTPEGPHPTVCDRARPKALEEQSTNDLADHVRRVVEQYLPGMADAELTYSEEITECSGADHACPTSHLKAKQLPGIAPERKVIMLSKRFGNGKFDHPQYARLTLDSHGKVVKLAVSR